LAAEDLNVTQAAISRQVHELEGLLGASLFRKEGRGVVLTDAGHRLAQRLAVDLDRLRQTMTNAAAAGAGDEILSIAVLPTFASRWLAPRLSLFKALEPRVQLALHSRSAPFDLAREGIDLAIHFGSNAWTSGNPTPLCPENLVAVASPILVDRYEVTCPGDCQRLPLLHLQSRCTAWQDFLEQVTGVPKRARAGMLFDQFSTMIACAINGLGAAIVPAYLIETELALGTLVALGKPEASDGMYYVVQPRGIHNPLADRFADWLGQEAQMSSRRRAVSQSAV